MNTPISDNILSLIANTPQTVLTAIAQNIRQRRLERNWTQQLLAAKADMPLSTYRRFEKTGQISLHSLVLVAFALGLESDFQDLFTRQSFQSMDELLNAKKQNNVNEQVKMNNIKILEIWMNQEQVGRMAVITHDTASF
ncbi:MAG: helix-turn-helix domain-containing protein [Tannerellaceae bacterium]